MMDSYDTTLRLERARKARRAELKAFLKGTRVAQRKAAIKRAATMPLTDQQRNQGRAGA